MFINVFPDLSKLRIVACLIDDVLTHPTRMVYRFPIRQKSGIHPGTPDGSYSQRQLHRSTRQARFASNLDRKRMPSYSVEMASMISTEDGFND
jgi:hypothetical protein